MSQQPNSKHDTEGNEISQQQLEELIAEVAALRKDLEKKASRIEVLESDIDELQTEKSNLLQVNAALYDANKIFQRKAKFDVEIHRSSYKALFEASHEILTVFDKEANMLDINRVLGGVEKAQILGSGWKKMYPREMVADMERRIAQLSVDDVPQKYEYEMHNPDGSTTYLLSSIVSLPDVDGEKRFLGTSSDISDLKLSQLEAQKNRNYYQSLFESSHEMLTVFDEDAGILDINNPPPGTTLQMLQNDGWKKVYPEHTVEQLVAQVKEVADKGESVSFHSNSVHPDGSKYYYYNTISEIAPDGGKRRFLGTTADITERKLVESSAKARQDFIQGINETVPLLLYVYNIKEQKNEFTNRELGEVLGYSTAQFRKLQNGVLDILHPHDLKTVIEHQKQVLSADDDQVNYVEYRVKDASKNWRWFGSWDRVSQRASNGEVTHYIGAAQDITTSKESLLRVEEQNRLIHAVNSTVPLIVFIHDLAEGEAIYTNRSQVELHGYTAEELKEKEHGAFEIIYQDDLQLVQDHMAQLVQASDDEVLLLEYRVKHKSGEIRWLSNWNRVFKRDHEGNVTQFIGAVQDITDLKAKDIEISANEKYFRGIFKGSSDTLVVFDREFNIVDANHELFGFPVEMLAGDKWQKALDQEAVQKISQNLNYAYASTDSRQEFEIRVNPNNKGFRSFANGLTIIKSTDGSDQVLMSSTEITELYTIQENLSVALSESSRRGEELAKSNEELEQFAYVASHDLQEPIRIVSQYLQLLERHLGDNLDDTSKEYVRFAVGASKRMRDLINGLLEFARMNNQKLHLQEIDTHTIAQGVIEFAERLIKEANASIEFDSMPVIKCDPVLMSQLFQNLLNNAIKFRRPDVDLKIKITHRLENEFHVFSISDNGIGIDDKLLDQVFVIFKRGHIKEEYAGHGIGLTLGKRIIERHGGKMWLESEKGSGTTVFFSVPVKPSNFEQL